MAKQKKISQKDYIELGKVLSLRCKEEMKQESIRLFCQIHGIAMSKPHSTVNMKRELKKLPSLFGEENARC